MASYTVTHTDGTAYTIVGEGVADNSLGISLIGQNYHNYGQLIANNFLHLLENQANSTPPLNPQAGQLWWNSATKVLSVFNGNQFKPCSSSAVGSSPPVKPVAGDQWWDTSTDQLLAYSGSEWLTVGPLSQKGEQFTGVTDQVVTDSNGAAHTIAVVQVAGENALIVSKDSRFYLPVGQEILGASIISPGVTLAPSTTIVGTADNANKLGGIAASSYISSDSEESVLNGNLQINGVTGLSVGTMSISKNANNSVSLHSSLGDIIIAAGTAAITCQSSGAITVSREPTVDASIATKLYVDQITSAATAATRSYIDTQTSAIIDNSPIPTLKSLSTAIGNDANFAANMSAALNFKAPKLDPVFVGSPRAPTQPINDSSTKLATTEFVQQLFSPFTSSTGGLVTTGSIIPTKDNVFDIGSLPYRFKTFYGTAMQANYADLAEIYATDAVYRPGTVVVFGGKAEVTTSDQQCDSRVAGVISTNPAYLMNGTANGQAVALTGKVPCKVVGPVKKGDLLVNSKFAGVATVLPPGSWTPGCTIGKSLEDSNETSIRNVIIAVGRF